MSKRRHSRQTARRRAKIARVPAPHSLYRRSLRYERLEDRRLLAVVTVNTLSDSIDFNDGLTSLREAIFATNTVPGADTIEFAPSLTASGPATILLTKGELKITDSLTINGPGASLLTIDASGNDPTPDINNGDGSRIFNVTDGSNIANSWQRILDVSLARMSLTGGDCSLYGGAIYCTESLSLDGLMIANNAATDWGGGLMFYTFSSEVLTINNASIMGNEASWGGGINLWTAGSSTINQSVISNNRSTGPGGGLDISAAGALTIANCTIAGNEGQSALSLNAYLDATVDILNTAISGNRSNPAGFAQGSGAYLSASNAKVRIRSSVIEGNSDGGLDLTANDDGEIIVEQCTIVANRDAGGISIYSAGSEFIPPGSVRITECTVSGNSSRFGGGGIGAYAVGGVVQIDHSTIVANHVENWYGDWPDGISVGGIAIVNYGGPQVIVDHVIVAENSGPPNASQDIEIEGKFTLTNTLVGDNDGSSLAEAPIGLPDANGNFIGGPLHGVIDPKLGELTDNGGFTLPDGSHILTHALLPGSPAINAGNLNAVPGVDGVPQFDERGTPYSRVVGGRIDIGAFEYQQPSDLNLLVDTLVDESDGNYSRGDLSLREAIELANKYSSVDTIHFDPALTASGPATILLTKGELTITDSLALNGPGSNLLTIDASGNDPTPTIDDGRGSRVLAITGPKGGVPINVSISGLQLTGGDAVFRGGAINSTTANLTLTNSTITGNSIVGSGGGVVALYGNIAVIESSISGNTASGPEAKGGGLYLGLATKSSNPLTVQIRRSEIVNNTAPSHGGGLYALWFAPTAFTITNSRISGNKTTALSGSGGGLYIKGIGGPQATLALEQVTIDHNTINQDANGGAGMFLAGINTTITNSEISANVGGRNGGGIASNGLNSLSISGSTISGNTAKRLGGGLWTIVGVGAPTNSLTITDCSIASNTISTIASGSSAGGGVYLELRSLGTAIITGTTFRENTATSGGGGAALFIGGEMLITECRFQGNNAIGTNGGAGGAIFLSGDVGLATIRNSTFEENVAQRTQSISAGLGGAIYARGPKVLIEGTRIASNISAWRGGGLFLSGGNTTISHSQIVGNTALGTQGAGGGIFQHGSTMPGATGEFLVTDSTISGNTATMNGGGVFLYRGTASATLQRVNISDNSAGQDGGGIATFWRTAVLTSSTVSHNAAGRDGGGIAVLEASKFVTDSSTINKNTAGQNGGGIAVIDGAASVMNSTISGNQADDSGGGLWSSISTMLANTTIYQNRAEQTGGGVFIATGKGSVSNTIIAGNTAPFGRDITGLLGVTFDLHYSLIGSNQSSGLTPAPVGSPDANGNLIGHSAGSAGYDFIDPLLGLLANNGGPTQTHALLPGSPAINVGDPAATAGSNGVPLTDQRGAPFTRVYGGRIDMGAVESQPNVLAGDYNSDGVVDARDYIVWRKATATNDLHADGNGDSKVDAADYKIWRMDFGQTAVTRTEVNAAVSLSVVAQRVELPTPALIADLAIVDVPLAPRTVPPMEPEKSAPPASHGYRLRAFYRPTIQAANAAYELATKRAVLAERLAFAEEVAVRSVEEGGDASGGDVAALDDLFATIALSPHDEI